MLQQRSAVRVHSNPGPALTTHTAPGTLAAAEPRALRALKGAAGGSPRPPGRDEIPQPVHNSTLMISAPSHVTAGAVASIWFRSQWLGPYLHLVVSSYRISRKFLHRGTAVVGVAGCTPTNKRW